MSPELTAMDTLLAKHLDIVDVLPVTDGLKKLLRRWVRDMREHYRNVDKYGRVFRDVTSLIAWMAAGKPKQSIWDIANLYKDEIYEETGIMARGRESVVAPMVVAKALNHFVNDSIKNPTFIIGVEDLDDNNLISDDIRNFISMISNSEYRQYEVWCELKAFQKWWENNNLIYKAKPGEMITLAFRHIEMEKPGGEKGGRSHTHDELVQIFKALDEYGSVEIRERFGIYARIMLQTGLRPSHAFCIRPSDFDLDKEELDIFGNSFIPIDIKKSFIAWKAQFGLKPSQKKRIPNMVYISRELVDQIIKYYDKNVAETGSEFALGGTITDNSSKYRLAEVRRITGIADFQWKNLRKTWATVIFVLAEGRDATEKMMVVTEAGGWGESETVLSHYAETIHTDEGVAIAKDFKIHLPPGCHRRTRVEVKREEEEIPPTQFEHLVAMMNDMRETYERELDVQTKRGEELKKELKLLKEEVGGE